MSNGAALQPSSSKPLQTITEATNSDHGPSECGDSRLQQYEEAHRPSVASSGTEQRQSSHSDSLARLEEGGSPPRIDTPRRTGHPGLRTR